MGECDDRKGLGEGSAVEGCAGAGVGAGVVGLRCGGAEGGDHKGGEARGGGLVLEVLWNMGVHGGICGW